MKMYLNNLKTNQNTVKQETCDVISRSSKNKQQINLKLSTRYNFEIK